MMDRVMSSTRYIVVLAVISCLALSAFLFVAATAGTVTVIIEKAAKLGSEKATKELAITAIEQADNFLIATALLIVGIGLYELFIGPVTQPEWLLIKSIDDLKDKLINVVVVVLAVTFLRYVTLWDGTTDVLTLGGAIAVVTLALAGFGLLKVAKKGGAAEH